MPGRKNKPYIDARGYWTTRIAGSYKHLGRASGHARRRKQSGKSYTIRTGLPEDRAALARFHQFMAGANKQVAERAPAAIAGLIEHWRKQYADDDIKYRILPFSRYANRLTLPNLSPHLLIDYARSLRKTYAPKSIIDRVYIAARCLRWGAHTDRRWVTAVPIMPTLGSGADKMSRPVHKARDVDVGYLAQVLSSLPNRARQVLTFCAATGARPGEARLLRWSEVDLRTQTCVLDKHKTSDQTGQARTLYLTPPALAILEQLPGPRAEFVFLSRLDRPYTAGGLRTILRRRGNITPYQLRHTFGQIGSEQLNEQDLAVLMGHQTVRTTRHYFNVRNTRARNLASKLSLPQVKQPPPQSPQPLGACGKSKRPKRHPADKRPARPA